MPDNPTDIAVKPHSEGAGTWLAHNVFDPLMNAGPLGIYNTVADLTHLPECHLAVDEAKPYSADWFVQGLSSGVGYVLPYMLAAAGTGAAMRGADGALASTRVGESLSPLLQSQRAATVLGASLYAGLQKPESGHTRIGNALGTGLGFLVFDQGNMLGKTLPTAARIASYPLVGFAGGAAMSEGTQLFSNGHLAASDQVLQSAVQGMTLNTVMPLAQEGLKSLKESRAAKSSEPSSAGQDLRNDGQRAASDQSAQRQSGSLEQLGDRQSVKPNALISAQAGDQLSGQPSGQATDLAGVSKAYSDWVKANKVAYPDPEQFQNLTPNEIVNRGFYHPDATNLDQLTTFVDHGHHHGPPPLPDAHVVADEVGKSVGSMPLAQGTGDLTIGEWNMEFLNADKARYFKDTYSQIIPRHHLLFAEEADEGGLKQIAQDNGYNYAISEANSRGQAVGFLINPRLKVLGTQSYDNVAQVHNIPDLRPAFRLDLQDTATGQKFSAVAVHLKSMRGGPDATAAVRTEQANLIAKDLGPSFSGVVAGDWNTFLDKTNQLDGLKNAGFKMLDSGDHTSTQSMGGRLDGFFAKNMPGSFSHVQVRPFFQNPLITRGLSDHGLLSTVLHLTSSDGQASN